LRQFYNTIVQVGRGKNKGLLDIFLFQFGKLLKQFLAIGVSCEALPNSHIVAIGASGYSTVLIIDQTKPNSVGEQRVFLLNNLREIFSPLPCFLHTTF
jgi:hypothetical protein